MEILGRPVCLARPWPNFQFQCDSRRKIGLPSKPSSTRSPRRTSAAGSARLAVSASMQEAAKSAVEVVRWAFSEDPASWGAALVANGVVFAVGFPLLRAGLNWPGVANAFILGSVLWRAFGGQGLLVAAIYFCLGTGATKVKMKQKEAEGIAEKRSGKRGPASVWGSGSAGIVCALAAAAGVGGSGFLPLWKLAFVASFCTKLSDTVSSEIGKAYGRTTYLVTNLSIVPRGTEGAVSLEGTAAGLVASVLLSSASWALKEVDFSGVIICVVSSQVANLVESYLGATLQGKRGFEWLNNDIVNVLNIATGSSLAILLKLVFFPHTLDIRFLF